MVMIGSDQLGFALLLGFGLWWVFLPASVIRFYSWFHRGKVKLPPPRGIRLAGGLWCAVAGLILWSHLSR
jgi:hypothetical protein